jgi:dienelactone hydrolase
MVSTAEVPFAGPDATPPIDEPAPGPTEGQAEGQAAVAFDGPSSDRRLELGLALRGLVAPAIRSLAYWLPGPQRRRRRRHDEAGIPMPGPSLWSAAHVALDEVVLGGFMLVRRPPSEASFFRIRREVDDARALYERRGWDRDAAAYHRTPPALTDAQVRVRHSRSVQLQYETITFLSEWAPHPGEPGRDRWLRYRPNHVAAAHVLRHADPPGSPPRPWVVCVHGTQMGRADLDLRIFRARHLYSDLGCNVALPVLPLHGRRKAANDRDAEFPSIDVVDNVHGLAQGAWDVRRLLSWIRRQEPAGIAVVGLSLGGGVAALVGSLEAVDAVVPCVPAVDFPAIFRRATPRELRQREHYQVLGAPADALHSVVSPLRMAPATPPEARFLFAGLTDRLLDPVDQAAALWEHWDRPEIKWFQGGHVGHMMSREITAYVDDVLARRGFVAG